MFDQDVRLARLLARHRDATVVSPIPERPTVIRRDQLLVADQDAAAVEDLVRRWVDRREQHPGITRLRLRALAKVDVCELSTQLSDADRQRAPAVSPNHLLHGQPLWFASGAGPPRPVAPLPPLPAPVGGRRVGVAVLDTGLSPHPWYDTADWYGPQRADVTEVLDADLDYELDAQAGHGTFVSGVILQHAPGAALRACRMLGSDGVGDELALVSALAGLSGIELVHISAGCHTYDDRPSPVVAHAVAALGRGTVVVACAGNGATSRPFWPAALTTVVAVAALNATGTHRAWYSNYGWWVDAAAVGSEVRSCFVRFDGTRPRIGPLDPDDFEGYASWTGTSFAAPVVTGAIARAMAAAGLSAAAAAARVLDPRAAATHPDLGVIIKTQPHSGGEAATAARLPPSVSPPSL